MGQSLFHPALPYNLLKEVLKFIIKKKIKYKENMNSFSENYKDYFNSYK